MTTTSLSEQTNTSDTNRTSQSLIVQAKALDPHAWERMVKLYSPLVYFWCQESGLPQSDVHDVFQDVFHALARDIKKFRPIENGTFRGWLRTMTRNKVNDHFRRAVREPRAFGGSEALNYFEQVPAATHRSLTSDSTSAPNGENRHTENEIQSAMLCEALANIRSSFTEQTWNAFWMVVIDGRETNEVAEKLDMRAGTVRVAKSRVLKRLRLEVGDSIE